MSHAPLYIFDKTAELKRLSEMIFVEGGTFIMGDDERNWDGTEYSKHFVKLDSFYIGKYPVTQTLWKVVMNDENPSEFKRYDSPVERVSWEDTQVFIEKLNQQTGKIFRLPTEAEWEYAAKGGIYFQDFPFLYSGSNKLTEVGWNGGDSHEETKPVGLKTPNFLGVHDMSGNVWEWCNDWYDANYYKNSAQVNPKGAKSGSSRVVRGGSWYSNYYVCRSSKRYKQGSDIRSNDLGFRLVRC